MLAAVPDVEPEPDPDPLVMPPPPVPVDVLDDDVPGRPERFSDVVARDLDDVFSAHPAAATLQALSLRLARALDDPYLDPRATATVARELRATVADLVRSEGADDDDLFGDGPGAPVVVPSTG